ncbi:MAG: Ku protein [Peptococcaceae bacterium]|nr:Ku protein [Peptococcaceae bacterium]
MRPLWKGAMTFGLVYIPVKLYTATDKKDVKFNLLHKECHTPIRYRRFCPYCEEEVPPEEIVRGYEYEKGRYVVLSEEDLEAAVPEGGKNIALIDFVDLHEIDPIYFIKPYYLTPAEGGEKVYELLRQAMAESEKVGIARVVIRSKETLSAVRVYNDVLVMNTMLYPDEVRSPKALPELNYRVKVHENEKKMALSLINNLSAEFKPEKYTDERREALLDVIRAKVAGEAAVKPPARDAENVVDLIEALRSSIELAKKERREAKTEQKRRRTGS